jgi:hypothetical protein|tara:strand:+ start:18382 stop:19050 length:669 start_codon:yes stop_codon:yes gene_type:complete
LIYSGIDFSLNSPGACTQDHKGKYTFITFFNYGNRVWDEKGRKIPKSFSVHKELMDNKTILGFPYYRQVKDKDFLLREREKLTDGQNIADLISNILITLYGTEDHRVALEGFSYGSKGNSFIDIVQYNTFLRNEIVNSWGVENISIYQPSHVKKLAGKGNANKHYMVKAFQDDVFNDSDLRKTKLWKWTQGKDFTEKIPKPIDDLVDAYFILNANKKKESEQ